MSELIHNDSPIPLRLHVLGLAHTRANKKYSTCSFTTLGRNFCAMMKAKGYEIKYYGTPGSEVVCDEFIPCLTEDEFNHYFGMNDQQKYVYYGENRKKDDAGWKRFSKRCKRILAERIVNREIVVASYGLKHAFFVNMPNVISVDAHFGHINACTTYKVYPSKTWRSHVYALNSKADAKQYEIPPYWNDAVIHHYLPLDEFPYVEEKEDYVVFIGRLTMAKGVYHAISACQELNIPIKVAGPLYRDTEQVFLDYLHDHPVAEYVGMVDGEERAKLVSHSKGLLCPTLGNEPFGLVAIEAMAMGTPVIATDWGGFSETVVHGKTGFLVGYYTEWLYALKHIQTIRPSDCRQWVEANFSTDVVSTYYDRFFRRICAIESAQGNKWYKADLDGDHPISQTLRYPWPS